MHAWSSDQPPGAGRAPSPVQRRFWFLEQRFRGWRGLVVADAYRLDGALDPRALSDGLAAALERSQHWTWTVATEQGVPHVTVETRPVVDWRFADLSGGGPDRVQRVAAVLEEHAREPLALEGGPALRCVLVRLAPASHAVLLAAHRARADEVAMDALWTGLARAYGDAGLPGVRADGDAGLPGVRGDGETAGGHASGTGHGAAGQRERFWRRALAGAPALDMPLDHPRPPAPGPDGGLVRGRVTARGAERLATIAAELDQPFEAAVLAAFGTLLGRHCGQDDVVVAVPALPGRTAVAAGGGAGDVLPVRLDLSGDPPFGDLVARAGGALAAARAHGGAYDQIVRWSGAARWADRMPLAQAACAVGPPRPAPAAPAGIAVRRLALPPEPPLGEVALEVAWQPDDRPRAVLRYDAALFDPATARVWARHLGNLAGGARTDVPLSRLPLASGGERHWVRQRCAGRGQDLAAPTVVEAIERRVRAAPESVAAEHGAEGLTYGELSARAYRLAHHLRGLGCRAGTPVALLAERSLDFAVATLGILYASATCVPIDTAYPRERRALLLRDSGAPVVVTHGDLVERDGTTEVVSPGAAVVRLDADAARIAGQPGQRPPFDARPGDLAYVLYTSGSTGTPRAVGLGHAGLANAVAAAAERYGIETSDRMLQFASLSFDISLEEMLTAWTVGATVVFRPADVDVAGQPWLDWLRDRRITACSLPTAYWHGWVADLASLGARVPEGLRTVTVGGERAHAATYLRWLRAGGDRARFFNTYGPTEATITATAVELPAQAGLVPDQLPIGSPLPGTQAHVLDERGQESPVGITGELCLGGVQLARGYLGSPAATAERFVPHPFATTPGERLYRTGDLARLRADGQLAFCGRVDTQVKVRGFRVEPGEVESALRGHPAVADAAVVACRRGAATQLVGYAVLARTGAHGGAGPAGEALRDHLRQRLPGHLVPAQVTVVGELPLTPNGKVDRDALAGPGWAGEASTAATGAGTAATGERAGATEAVVAALWCETLGVPAARPGDGFFEAGGDSCLAVRLVTRIEREFGVALGVRSVFAEPLLHQVAAAVRAGVAGEPRGSGAAGDGAGPEGAARGVAEVIAGIWQELLGVAHVGGDDDFFELGGQSLLAIQTVALAREQGVEIPLRLIFDHPKVRDLARAVAAPGPGAS